MGGERMEICEDFPGGCAYCASTPPTLPLMVPTSLRSATSSASKADLRGRSASRRAADSILLLAAACTSSLALLNSTRRPATTPCRDSSSRVFARSASEAEAPPSLLASSFTMPRTRARSASSRADTRAARRALSLLCSPACYSYNLGHNYTQSLPTALGAAMRGGMDAACDPFFQPSVVPSFESGNVSLGTLATAGARFLTQVFDVGLMDPPGNNPYWQYGKERVDTAEARALAFQVKAARQRAPGLRLARSSESGSP